jgi:hypothetical protein
MRSETFVQQHPPTPPEIKPECSPGLQRNTRYSEARSFALHGEEDGCGAHKAPYHTPRVDSHSGDTIQLLNHYVGASDPVRH